MRSIKKALRKQIDPQQREYMNGVRWLVNDGPRGSGRTHLLAIAFVDKAICCGHPVHVWDHYPYNPGRGAQHLFMEIDKVVQNVNMAHPYKILKLHINQSQRSIQIEVLRDPACTPIPEYIGEFPTEDIQIHRTKLKPEERYVCHCSDGLIVYTDLPACDRIQCPHCLQWYEVYDNEKGRGVTIT